MIPSPPRIIEIGPHLPHYPSPFPLLLESLATSIAREFRVTSLFVIITLLFEINRFSCFSVIDSISGYSPDTAVLFRGLLRKSGGPIEHNFHDSSHSRTLVGRECPDLIRIWSNWPIRDRTDTILMADVHGD